LTVYVELVAHALLMYVPRNATAYKGDDMADLDKRNRKFLSQIFYSWEESYWKNQTSKTRDIYLN
jgi:NAD dependent epimerase/dehydratase family enzyme